MSRTNEKKNVQGRRNGLLHIFGAGSRNSTLYCDTRPGRQGTSLASVLGCASERCDTASNARVLATMVSR